MNVCLISIGNELLSGKTINTNASFLAKKLTNLGFVVKKRTHTKIYYEQTRIFLLPQECHQLSRR